MNVYNDHGHYRGNNKENKPVFDLARYGDGQERCRQEAELHVAGREVKTTREDVRKEHIDIQIGPLPESTIDGTQFKGDFGAERDEPH